jgi:hypothetical protein
LIKIDGIIIGTYKGDFWLTKICVASIRHWYDDFPIYIYKDKARGDFNTTELEKNWNVSVIELERNAFGSPLSKLFINFLHPSKKYLVIDSDIVFLGKVIEKLHLFQEDFIVNEHKTPDNSTDFFNHTYYNIERVLQLDPQFKYPGYVFNGGQVVVTTGLINRKDLTPFAALDGVLEIKDPETFKNFDQGIYNYVLPKLESAGRLSIGKADFMIWGEKTHISSTSLQDVIDKKSHSYLIHWAGTMKPLLRKVDGGEFLMFFEKEYYSKVPFGIIKRSYAVLVRELRRGFFYSMLASIYRKMKR